MFTLLPRRAVTLLLLALSLSLTACDSGSDEPDPDPPTTTGSITGQFSLPAGASGSVDNARVALYTSQAEFDQENPIRTTAVVSGGTYTFSGVNPGNYYLDVWKDNDNSRSYTAGDFYGAYTTNGSNASAFSVVAGQATTINGTILVLTGRPAPGERPLMSGAPATSR